MRSWKISFCRSSILQGIVSVSYTHLDVYKRQVLTLLTLVLFIGGQTLGGAVFLVLAFLVSPFGIPAIADWLVERLHSINYTLRDFITG